MLPKYALKKSRQNPPGFTLAEVLLAAGILVFVLCGILALFISALFLNEANRNRTVAVSHAQFVMEEIKNTAFSSIKANIDNGNWDLNAVTIGSRGLSALANESIDSNATGTSLLDITVTVMWVDRQTRNRSISLETLISEP